MVFASMSYSSDSLAHIKRQVSDLQVAFVQQRTATITTTSTPLAGPASPARDLRISLSLSLQLTCLHSSLVVFSPFSFSTLLLQHYSLFPALLSSRFIVYLHFMFIFVLLFYPLWFSLITCSSVYLFMFSFIIFSLSYHSLSHFSNLSSDFFSSFQDSLVLCPYILLVNINTHAICRFGYVKFIILSTHQGLLPWSSSSPIFFFFFNLLFYFCFCRLFPLTIYHIPVCLQPQTFFFSFSECGKDSFFIYFMHYNTCAALNCVNV